MSTKPSKHQTVTATDITKALQRATYAGLRPSEVWSDWLFITEASLRMLPVHAKSIHETATLAQDPPEIAEEWKRIQQRYGDDFLPLVHAYALLLTVAQPTDGPPEICDILGPLYMEFGGSNIHLGQFFTPWEMCVTIAKVTMVDAPAEVLRRMEQALQHDPVHATLLSHRTGWITPEIGQYVAEHMLPTVWEHFQPLTIHDPCVGSGGMLLAAAAEFPRWMIGLGLVRFSGQDISRDCVLMARINEMLFGLNGWGLRYQRAAHQIYTSPLAERLRESLQESSNPAVPEPMISTLPTTIDILYPESYPEFSTGEQGRLFEPTAHYAVRRAA